jgi:hypothetical protein
MHAIQMATSAFPAEGGAPAEEGAALELAFQRPQVRQCSHAG